MIYYNGKKVNKVYFGQNRKPVRIVMINGKVVFQDNNWKS